MPKIFISSIILLIEGIRFVAYRKQQIFRGTKLSRFTGYLGKTVAVLLNYNTYLNEPLKLVEKTFAFCRKSRKFCTAEDLLLLLLLDYNVQISIVSIVYMIR